MLIESVGRQNAAVIADELMESGNPIGEAIALYLAIDPQLDLSLTTIQRAINTTATGKEAVIRKKETVKRALEDVWEAPTELPQVTREHAFKGVWTAQAITPTSFHPAIPTKTTDYL